jgi:hypothetical protein
VPTMYEAASLNYREVEKALTQLERSVASALRRSDDSSVHALTRLQLLVVSVKAEARLTKIAHTPKGFTSTEREAVLSEDNSLERWKVAVDVAFRRHYKVPTASSFSRTLDHDALAKYSTLHSLISNELKLIISLRNKLAHGQWVYPFNTALSAVEPSVVRALTAETTLSARYRDRLLTQLGNIVVDLVLSAPSFEARFNEYFVRIRRYTQLLADENYNKWVGSVRATKVALTLVSPIATPANS